MEKDIGQFASQSLFRSHVITDDTQSYVKVQTDDKSTSHYMQLLFYGKQHGLIEKNKKYLSP